MAKKEEKKEEKVKDSKADIKDVKEGEKYVPLFKIDVNPKTAKLPDYKSKQEIDVRYPLMEPYVYAHIYWDEKQQDLIYQLEEPVLNEEEKKVLKTLEKGIEELINISFIGIKEISAVIGYLEKNVKVLLSELSISISKDTFLKVMYYIYRDFVGLNRIEALMKDYYIEDIECNGVKSNLYIVHRKYRNIRTNIVYNELSELTSFVEKLAQKSGKYISYASPLLDGRLPDGSRINATYTQEISSKGPTFTIRKFTKTPWSPVQLMQLKTVSPEVLAYLWLLVEHEANLIVIGGTGSGKCVTEDTKVYLSNNKVEKIGKLIENKFKGNKIKKSDGWEFLEGDGTKILSMNKNNLKIEEAKISKFWRHKAPNKLFKIKTRSGRSITTTPEHPFFTLNEGGVVKIRADRLCNNSRIAVPRFIPFFGNKAKIDLIKYLSGEKDIYVTDISDQIKEIAELLVKKYELRNQKELCDKVNYNYNVFNSWKRENAIPFMEYSKLIKLSGKEIRNNLILKGKTNSFSIKLPKTSKELFRFLALVIADGHLRRNYVEFHNTNKDLLNEFIVLSKKLFDVDSKVEDYGHRVPRVRLNSCVVAKLLNKAFEIPYGKKSSKVIVPKILFGQDNERVSSFISGIFDCEGHVAKQELEIGMNSEEFLDGLSTLFLRFGIVPRTRKRRIIISGFNDVKLFKDNIYLKHNDKSKRLISLLNKNIRRSISNVDLIPNCANTIKDLRLNLGLNQREFSDKIGVSRRLVGMWETGFRNPSIMTFNNIADFAEDYGYENIVKVARSDLFWDEIVEIKELSNHNEKYVYDLTVDEHHNFLAGNIPIIAHNTTMLNTIAFFVPPAQRIVSIEDTHELSLTHENWLPSVARAGFGAVTKEGKMHGEVSLFDLLKESFRQRPDYVIVGEIRGQEAYVLFQGAASIKGEEKIIVLNSDKPKRIAIKDLKDNVKYKAITIDPEDGKVKILPVKFKVQHEPRKELYKIKTKSGREVVVTSDHSVFGYDGKIIPLRAEELKEGDGIVVPSRIPCGYADMDYINLIDELDDIRVYAPVLIREAVKKLSYDKCCEICDVKAVSDYYANFTANEASALKADKFAKLMKEAGIKYNLNDLKVRLKYSEKVSPKLELSEELLKLIGYYLADGSMNESGKNSKLSFYNKDERVLNEMRECIMKVVGRKPRERICERGFGICTELCFSSKILCEFIKKHFGKKDSKRIGDFIFGLSKEKIGWFLSGLWAGDGGIYRNRFCYYTRLKPLANDVAQLLMVYGILCSINVRKHNGKDFYTLIFYNKKEKERFLEYVKPINKKIDLSDIKKENKSRFINDIYVDKIKSIDKITLDKEEPVYDISVPGSQNFIGGFGGIMLHNSGHATMSTMHAEDVQTMIRRLETKPISLSPALVKTLNVVCVMTQAKVKGKPVRRLREVAEIVDVNMKTGEASTNSPFVWDPRSDRFFFKSQSQLLDKIAIQYGLRKEDLYREFQLRARLLMNLYRNKVFGFKEVGDIIRRYYKNKTEVLRKYGVIR